MKTTVKKESGHDMKKLERLMTAGFANMGKQHEKLAQLVADGFADIDERFEQIDERFDKMDERFERMDKRFQSLESEVHNGFTITQRHLERIETRIAALEYAVFGVDGTKKHPTSTSWFTRIEELEKAVFKK